MLEGHLYIPTDGLPEGFEGYPHVLHARNPFAARCGLRTDFVASARNPSATLEATQGGFNGLFSQLPYECHQNRVTFERD